MSATTDIRNEQVTGARRTSWHRSIMDWRNWRLPVKLAAVLIVPAVLAVVLGVSEIGNDVDSAQSYADIERLVRFRADLMPLIRDIQRERVLAVERLSGAVPVDPAETKRRAAAVDAARAVLTSAEPTTPDVDGVAAARYGDAVAALNGLLVVRQQVDAGDVDPIEIAGRYGQITKALLDLDEALANQVGAQQLSGPAAALYDIEMAQEQVGAEQAIVLAALGRGHLLDTDQRALQGADSVLADRLDDFRAVATPDEQQAYWHTVSGPAVNQRLALVRMALTQPLTVQASTTTVRSRRDRTVESTAGGTQPAPVPMSVQDWNNSSDTVQALMTKAENDLADRLRTTAAGLQDARSNEAGAESVALLAVLLLAVGIGFVIGRALLGSLAVLRRTALDVADHRLPAAVAGIRDGTTPSVTIDPVPVDTTEEFGQLARAFDAVNGQAVRAATEQAALRGNLRNIFVNLSRRSQSLVERQLKLMEQLERHEENPDQLSNLFKLDHLATRMRRNNENLMILAGSELARRFDSLVPLANVLRAAVSEIEHYQRTVVRSAPQAEVIGYAAGDLVRLIAELLDNATAFSPPDSQVVIDSRSGDDGAVLIDILDRGIGMSDHELADANRRVTPDGSDEIPVSRQMGLFVVGRLAGRHGITITLARQPDGEGLRVTVRVPAGLVRSAPQHGPVSGEPFTPAGLSPVEPAANGHAVRQPALPKRVPLAAAGPRHAAERDETSQPSSSDEPRREPTAGTAVWFGPVVPATAPAATGEPQPDKDDRLPSVPDADDAGFPWFDSPEEGGPAGAEQPLDSSVTARLPVIRDEAAAPAESSPPPAGLPKRVPKANLSQDLAEPLPTITVPPVRTTRDARRARGFLTSYQAGIRRSEAGPRPERTDGQENR